MNSSNLSRQKRFISSLLCSDLNSNQDLATSCSNNFFEGSKGISKIPKSAKKMDGNKKHLKGLSESKLPKTVPITGTSQPVAKDGNEKVIGSCMSIKESSLRKQLKAVILSDCKFEPLFSKDALVKDQKAANRPLPDPNKVNELDCLNNRNQSKPYPLGKTFFSQIMRTQFKMSSKRSPRKIFREKNFHSNTKRKIKKPLSDNQDDTLSHIKYIANCLLENTLNKLDIKESSKLIADHIDDPVVQTPESGTSSSSNFQVLDLPSSSTDPEDSGNNDSSGSESNDTSQDTVIDVMKRAFDNDTSVTSREALYDPNSRVDLLEDFDMSPLLEGFSSVQTISVSAPTNNVVLLGMRPLNEDDSAHPDGSVFPGWLLRILRNNFPANTQDTNREWAHFYSQGDGWGNNTPWIVRNNDENEDASSEASSSNDSSLTDSSSIQDIVSLPNDNVATGSSRNQRHIEHIRLHNEDSEEYFDTLDNIGAGS